MECNDIQEMLADYLGDELDPSFRNEFESHLAICPQCRDEVDSLRRTVRSLEQLCGPEVCNYQKAPLIKAKSHNSFAGKYALRLLRYVAMLMFGVLIGWFGRSNLSGWNPDFLQQMEHRIISRNPESQLSDPFIHNAITLSRAFSQPLDDSVR